MSCTGTVKNFDSKRGFGFITMDEKPDEEIFVHYEQIKTSERWPKLDAGMKVKFNKGQNEKNKRVCATDVTNADGSDIGKIEDKSKEFGEYRYPGTVKFFRGWTGAEGGFGFIELNLDAKVGDTEVPKGTSIYCSREEIFADNMKNPKIAGGMEVEFLVCKDSKGRLAASEVTLPNAVTIGDLPPREERPEGEKKKSGGKGKGRGKGKGKGKGKGNRGMWVWMG